VKKCSKCGEIKPKTEFSKSSYIRKDGIQSLRRWCKKCTYEQIQEWNHKNYGYVKTRKKKYFRNHKEQHKGSMLKNRYGISLEVYNELLEKQGGLCAICGQPETAKHQTGVTRSLGVDHNHITEEIRGLLCQKCNKLLGDAGDSCNILHKAYLYLSKIR